MMNDGIEIIYTFTVLNFFRKPGVPERSTLEYYWDEVLSEGGLRDKETKRNSPIIRRPGGESQMYVGSREEVLEIVRINKRANGIAA
jgi:hypothetical protein